MIQYYDAYFWRSKLTKSTDGGEAWEKEDGFVKGDTQYSCKGEGLYNYYSYGQQFEISYRSINPYGWPQLVFFVDLKIWIFLTCLPGDVGTWTQP